MSDTVQAINRLLALHGGSLPMYLASAPPHIGPGDARAWEVLQQIRVDQQLMIDKLADFVEANDGAPHPGEFPAEFTGYHDLSMDFILRDVRSRQAREIELIEAISASLEPGTHAKGLAQEALGAAKAHVQSLDETLATSA